MKYFIILLLIFNTVLLSTELEICKEDKQNIITSKYNSLFIKTKNNKAKIKFKTKFKKKPLLFNLDKNNKVYFKNITKEGFEIYSESSDFNLKYFASLPGVYNINGHKFEVKEKILKIDNKKINSFNILNENNVIISDFQTLNSTVDKKPIFSQYKNFDLNNINIFFNNICSSEEEKCSFIEDFNSVNISFIVDVSSSMDDKTLKNVEKTIKDLLKIYENKDLNYMVVQFWKNESSSTGWLNKIKDISLYKDKSGTDIEQGLSRLVQEYSKYKPNAEKNIVLYFGDGNTYGSYKKDFLNYLKDWKSFVKNNIDILEAVSINNKYLNDLKYLSGDIRPPEISILEWNSQEDISNISKDVVVVYSEEDFEELYKNLDLNYICSEKSNIFDQINKCEKDKKKYKKYSWMRGHFNQKCEKEEIDCEKARYKNETLGILTFDGNFEDLIKTLNIKSSLNTNFNCMSRYYDFLPRAYINNEKDHGKLCFDDFVQFCEKEASDTKIDIFDVKYVNSTNGNLETKINGRAFDVVYKCLDSDNQLKENCSLSKLELINMENCDNETTCSPEFVFLDNKTPYFMNNGLAFSTIEINNSYRNLKFRITGIIDNKEKIFISSDDFSVRPDGFFAKFNSDSTLELISEKTYKVSFEALDRDNKIDTSYNGSISYSLNKLLNDNTLNNNIDGNLDINASYFNNGISTATLEYDNVGTIEAIIKDEDWTKIDIDDTSYEDRVLEEKIYLYFLPYKFEIVNKNNVSFENENTLNKYTYFSNDLNLNSAKIKNLNFEIKVLGFKDGILTNYDSGNPLLFAREGVVSLIFDIPKDPVYINYPNNIDSVVYFDKGIGTLDIEDILINFERYYNLPKDPIYLNSSNSHYSLKYSEKKNVDLKAELTGDIQSEANFYYGKFEGVSEKDTESSVSLKNKILIYSSLPIHTFKNVGGNWYLFEKENDLSFSKYINFKINKDYKLKEDAVSIDTSIEGSYSGYLFQNINNLQKDGTFYFHYNIPKFLWNGVKSYSYDNYSDCSQHPCSVLEVKLGFKEDTVVKTGTNKGSKINLYIKPYQKIGLKLYR